MPPLALASVNQIGATSGVTPRLNLAEALQLQTPQLYADRSFDLQNRQLALAEEAEETRQSQQTGANIISGVGTAGQLGIAAARDWDKLQGAYTWGKGAYNSVFGPSTTATAAEVTGSSLGAGVTAGEAAGVSGEGALWGATAATPATTTAAAGGTAAAAGGTAAELGAAGAGTGAAAAGSGAGSTTGVLATAAPYAGVAGVGLTTGSLVGPSVRRAAGGGTKGAVAGAAAGAASGAGMGALAGTLIFPGVGTGVGALIGGAGGAISGGLCILHEASYGTDSPEVAIARRFRDTYLSTAQKRAYYALYEDVASTMRRDPTYRAHIRHTLTDRLVRVGASMLRVPYAPLEPGDLETAESFLEQLRVVGAQMGPYQRRSGEWV